MNPDPHDMPRRATTIVIFEKSSGRKLRFETPVQVDKTSVNSFAMLCSLDGAKHFQFDKEKNTVTVTFEKAENFAKLESEVPSILKAERIFTTVKHTRTERFLKAAAIGVRFAKRAFLLFAEFVKWALPVVKKGLDYLLVLVKTKSKK